MANQESEVKLFQELPWDYGWISRFSIRIIGKWFLVCTIHITIGMAVGVSVGGSGMAIG